jgi:hypothetical protein
MDYRFILKRDIFDVSHCIEVSGKIIFVKMNNPTEEYFLALSPENQRLFRALSPEDQEWTVDNDYDALTGVPLKRSAPNNNNNFQNFIVNEIPMTQQRLTMDQEIEILRQRVEEIANTSDALERDPSVQREYDNAIEAIQSAGYIIEVLTDDPTTGPFEVVVTKPANAAPDYRQ